MKNWWFKDFIMNISYLLIFTWNLYVLDHLFTPTGGMKKLFVHFSWHTLLVWFRCILLILGRFPCSCLFYLLVKILPICYLNAWSSWQYWDFVHKHCYQKNENCEIKEFEMDFMPNQSWQDIWLVRKGRSVIWNLLESNDQRDSK